MGLETATTIAELNALWPLGSDPKSQGDDHLRLIKSVMQNDALSKALGGTVQGLIDAAGFEVRSDDDNLAQLFHDPGQNRAFIQARVDGVDTFFSFSPTLDRGDSVVRVADGDARYVNRNGDTMTGQLTVNDVIFGNGPGSAARIKTRNTGEVQFDFAFVSGVNTLAWQFNNAGPLAFAATAINAQRLDILSNIPGGPTNVRLNVVDNSGNIWAIFVDGASDARIKENVAPTRIDALEVLNQVEIVEFDYTEDYMATLTGDSFGGRSRAQALQADRHVNAGIVAQQIEQLIPEAVAQMKDEQRGLDDLRTVHNGAAVPYLIRAVQQLSDTVQRLSDRITQLEAEVS